MADDAAKSSELSTSLERARASLLPQADMMRISRSVSQMQELMRGNHRSLASIASQISASSAALKLPTGYAALAREFESQSAISRLAGADPAVFKGLQAQASRWRTMSETLGVQVSRWRSVMEALDTSALRVRMPESAFEQLKRSALVWDAGLSEAMKRLSETNLLTSRADLCSRLLEPSRVLSRFAEETFARMQAAPGTRGLWALNASVSLADAQHLANIDALSDFATGYADDDELSEPRLLTAPFVQQEELLVVPDLGEDEDVDSLVARSPAAQAAERARAVLTLTTGCNKASRTKGAEEVFKPTTKVMEVFAELPWLIPQDEKGFGEFVDCLYFVLYEGAGKDKLRFLVDCGGPLARADCQVVWCIKILRNKWLRHDVDHGKPSDIERSWGDLNSNLRWLGSDGFPRSPSDFRRLHERLLVEAEEFLRKLFHAL